MSEDHDGIEMGITKLDACMVADESMPEKKRGHSLSSSQRWRLVSFMLVVLYLVIILYNAATAPVPISQAPSAAPSRPMLSDLTTVPAPISQVPSAAPSQPLLSHLTTPPSWVHSHAPSVAPSQAPTIYIQKPRSPADCLAIANGTAVSGQDGMHETFIGEFYFGVCRDIEDHVDMEELKRVFQQILVPEIILGCGTESPLFLEIGNALITSVEWTGTYVDTAPDAYDICPLLAMGMSVWLPYIHENTSVWPPIKQDLKEYLDLITNDTYPEYLNLTQELGLGGSYDLIEFYESIWH